MKGKPHDQQTRLDRVPRLVPAGSVNRVLLLGGKNLTLLQSLALICIGVCFVLGGVGSVIVFGFAGFLYLQLFACAIALWGFAMIANGIRSTVKRQRK